MIWLLCILPTTDRLEDTVDAIELNHCYEAKTGNHRFDQVIFWRRYRSGMRVVAWRWYKDVGSHPERVSRGWLLIWHDGPNLRRVRSVSFLETWTLYDPEVDDRAILPHEAREELRKPLDWP